MAGPKFTADVVGGAMDCLGATLLELTGAEKACVRPTWRGDPGGDAGGVLPRDWGE